MKYSSSYSKYSTARRVKKLPSYNLGVCIRSLSTNKCACLFCCFLCCFKKYYNCFAISQIYKISYTFFKFYHCCHIWCAEGRYFNYPSSWSSPYFQYFLHYSIIAHTFSDNVVFITGKTSYTQWGSKALPWRRSSDCFLEVTFWFTVSNWLKKSIL